MGPLPYGPGTGHIKASHGPDTMASKFYITEYSSKLGIEGFTPRPGKHRGTGYQSNFRPGVYYNRRIDELDNPNMGRLLTDNYDSVTQKHFRASKGSDGRDPLPKQVYMRKSGFVHNIRPTVPTTQQVRSVFVDTKNQGVVYPNAKPYLHDIQGKDPVSSENAGFGPKFMSTENKASFKGIPSKRVDLSTKIVGPKEDTGFTSAYNVEPITFKPNEAHDGRLPGWYTWRPTGTSLMKTDFMPSAYLDGNEPFTTLAVGSERDTGYTREIKPKGEFTQRQDQVFTSLSQVHPLVARRTQRNDPAEYKNMIYPKQHPSMTAATYRGQSKEQSLGEKLGNATVGPKEDTGFTDNNCKFVEVAETPLTLNRFNTLYKNRFSDKTPKGEQRMGNVKGNVFERLDNGFTKSTFIDKFGPELKPKEEIQKLEPYVARSIKTRDPFYFSHNHEDKKRLLAA